MSAVATAVSRLGASRRERPESKATAATECRLTNVAERNVGASLRGRPPKSAEMSKTPRARSTESPVGTIWTIGHSTRSAEEFNYILKVHEIAVLVDVRSFPGSKRYPQFNKEQLKQSLADVGISYLHSPALGGRRQPNPKSKNLAWKNASFRAYADHLETDEFRHGVKELLEVGGTERAVVMCAEALWWRCHRSLIADYLKSIGWEVLHIESEKQAQLHPYTSAARIVEGRLSYEGLF